MRRAVGLAALALLQGACGEDCLPPAPSGTTVRFADPGAGLGDALAHPWPSDALRTASGRLRLEHFGNPTGSSVWSDYRGIIARETRGFATTAAQYLGFSGALDLASLPATPQDATAEDSPIALVDIDPRSPERGRRYPLRLTFREAPTVYLPEHHLVVQVPYGIPLSGGTTYALWVTRDTRDRAGDRLEAAPTLRAALRGGCRDAISPGLFEAFAPLRGFLAEAPGAPDPSQLAGATVFTTQDAVAELAALAEVARAQPVPEVRGWTRVGLSGGMMRYRAELDLPGFQEGKVPFLSLGDGGALARDEAGRFTVTHQERTRIGVAVPARGQMPAAGWPVVLFSHGTGGDYRGAFDAAVATALGQHGIAVLGYDQTLHGPRDPTGSRPEITFFNLFNPVAARDNVRQGAADAVVLTSLLESLRVPSSVTEGAEVRFDPQRIVFVGHSQGALTGALFNAVDERARGMVHSGLGAILAITLVERKDIVDFQALLGSLLDLPEGEVLDEQHPVINLIQTFIEPADPISYAKATRGGVPGRARRDVLMVEGLLDFAAPARGQEAYATAAHLPVIAPVARVPEAAALVGPAPQEGPARENVSAAGGAVTWGLIQYPEETHFPIYEHPDARRRYVEFVRAVVHDGRGVIPRAE